MVVLTALERIRPAFYAPSFAQPTVNFQRQNHLIGALDQSVPEPERTSLNAKAVNLVSFLSVITVGQRQSLTMLKLGPYFGGDSVRHDGSDVSWLRSKFFAGLSDPAMRQLLDSAKVCHIAPKEPIIVKGDSPNRLVLLKTGRARCYVLTEDGREVVLLWAAPGEVVGLVSLLPSPPNYMVNTSTVSACDCLVWDHDTIRKVAAEHPPIMENGFRLALSHVSTYMKRHVNLVTKSAESRLANRLLHLANTAGEVNTSGIKIDITNEQLSSFADIGYFTTSRILSKWEHRGMLSKQRGAVTLLDPESLLEA